MYKSKLQELCHRKSWGLPKYSCVKDGPDHNPQFRASVFVDGSSYESLTVEKSSKEALNAAANVAFLHLNSGAEPSAEINSSSSDVKVGKQHLQHKMQLHSLAQSKNLDPPLYSCKTVGPPHALQFQAKVTIDGHSFESPGYFKNLKEAEHAAARVALVSLSVDVLQEVDACAYKSLLQEVTQNEGLTLPVYKTVRHGLPHDPTFFSTVEVEGEIFHGEGRKSKKLAELSAAKAAYLVFMKRQSTGDVETTSSGFSEENTKSTPSSDSLTNYDLRQICKHASSVGSSPVEGSEGYATDDEDETDYFLENSKVSSLHISPVKRQYSPSTLTPPDLSTLSMAASEPKNTVEMGSYLLCNKVRVYTSIPDIKLPEGAVLLPIDDHKWVAVSLEFPSKG